MSEEAPEGFAKKGTTLEGRVGQLLRLMGFNVKIDRLFISYRRTIDRAD